MVIGYDKSFILFGSKFQVRKHCRDINCHDWLMDGLNETNYGRYNENILILL